MADAIKQGRVEVNGVMAESFNQPVDPARDKVYLNGQRLNLKAEQIVCLMINKPEGVVSTAADEKGRPTVLDLLPAKYRKYRLFPVGRLDIDSTGLLLLTNDGDLTYRLTHPKFEQEKEYLVQVDEKLNRDEIQRLERGILLEDGMTAPAVVKRLMSGDYNYRIVIHEGRKRQVRRMFEHISHPIKALKRARIGTLRIGDLEEGEVRPLTGKELKELTPSARSLPEKKAIKRPAQTGPRPSAKPAVQPSTRPSNKLSMRPATGPSKKPSTRLSGKTPGRPSSRPSSRPGNRPGRPAGKAVSSLDDKPGKRPPFSLAKPNPRPSSRKYTKPGASPTGTPSKKSQTRSSGHSAERPPRFSKRKRV